MNPPITFVKRFSNGLEALAVRADPDANPAEIVKALDLPKTTRLLILSGGADQMSPEQVFRLKDLFAVIGRMLVQYGVTVIDGGTESGVMKLMGQALGRAGSNKISHIGVVPANVKIGTGDLQAEDVLEPHHSDFILVESDEWGGETEQMYKLAAHLSVEIPSVALLVNGGEIALREVELNVQQGREIIVITGSGRLADEIADAIRSPEQEARPKIKAIMQYGQFNLFDMKESPEKLVDLLREKLL